MAREEKVRLSIDGREVVNSYDALRKEARALKKEINGLEEGTDQWIKANANLARVEQQTAKLRVEQRKVKEGLKEATQATNEWKNSLFQIAPFGPQLQALNATLGKGVGVFNLITKSTNLFKVALASTGIGAIVVLLGSLISYLTSTQEGMDKVRKITEPVVSIFNRLKGVLQDLGKNVFGALAALAKGEFSQAWNLLKEGVTGAVQGVGEAVREGIKDGKELASLAIEIQKAENELLRMRGRSMRQISEQREIAQDASKSERERAEAAQEAIRLINELAAAEQKVTDLRIRDLDIRQDQNDTDRAGEREMIELINQKEEAEKRASDQRREINSLLNSLRKQESAADEKAINDRIKQLEKLQSEWEKLYAEQQALRQSFHDSQLSADEREMLAIDRKYSSILERTKKHYEAMQASLNLDAEQKEALEMEAGVRMAEIQDLWNQERTAKQQERFDADREARQAAQQEIDLELMSAQEREVMEIEQHYQNLLDLANQHGLDITGIMQARADALHEIERRRREMEEKADEESNRKRIQLAQQFGSLFGATLQLIADDSKQFAGLRVALTTAQILIDTASGISALTSNAAKGSLTPIDYAARVVGMVTILLGNMAKAKQALSQGASQVNGKEFKASSGQSRRSFYHGGETGDQYGPYAGFVHHHEYVIPSWLRKDPQVAAWESMIESKRINRMPGFFQGGPTTPPAFSQPSTTQAPDNAASMQLIEEIVRTLDQISKRPARANILFTELRQAFDQYNTIQKESEA